MSHDHECDHTRGLWGQRTTAITVCATCRDFLCSICGITIEWHAELYVTNPPVQWRYCTKSACVTAEATYHGLSVDAMIGCRAALRAKRCLAEANRGGSIDLEFQRRRAEVRISLVSPERIVSQPQAFRLDHGEACWCNLGKDCVGSHEIFIGEPEHVCGACGETFKITKTDPHWSSGRGPICPSNP